MKMQCWIVIQHAVRVKVAKIRREKEARLQRACKKAIATEAVKAGGSCRATRRHSMVEPVGGP